jgi:hypothetical protein
MPDVIHRAPAAEAVARAWGLTSLKFVVIHPNRPPEP